MFIRLTICILCFTVFFSSSSSFAFQVQGQMEVSILNPNEMDLKDLKKLCKEEPDTMACDVYEERLEEKNLKADRSYEVYTAHFQ